MAHHYQESDVSCGVAALQMALESAGVDAPPAAALAEELGTDLQGTRPDAIERALSARHLPYLAWYGDVTMGDLRHLLDDHALVVCYQSTGLCIGHFALVSDVTADAVELDDPWFGPGKRLPCTEFESMWESRPAGSPPLHHWVLGIRHSRSTGPERHT